MYSSQISGSLLDESQVASIVEEIKQVITASSSRKKERAERAKAEDFDAEEGELLKEEDEQEEEVFDQVSLLHLAVLYTQLFNFFVIWIHELLVFLFQIGEILGTLIKTFKASFLPFFDQLSSYLMPMWVSRYLFIFRDYDLFIHERSERIWISILNLNFVCSWLGTPFIYLYFFYLQGKDKTAEERRIAICIFDDVAEQCHESALKYVNMP